ncbi:MAG: NADP-dependent oxidoreductase [Candidatus Dormibacteraeota bacterium]|nr:NADP-dependent oxidoreductase [Candidatus Dormibacteraeota bacterium]
MPDDGVWDIDDADVADIEDGQLLVRVDYVSMDPAMRGWLDDKRSYLPPVAVGDVMRAIGVGEVVASRSDGFAEGDHVTGAFGVQQYAVATPASLTRIDLSMAPLPVFLSVLGSTGLTAYFGLLDIGQPEPGDTVVVSAAAGAVGSVAGQIAKIIGCRAVGIAGGPEKCRLVVEEFGFDAAIDYRSEDVAQRLRELCPERIDVYFDNVGGDILDAALTRLDRHARVVLCGAISQYNQGRMRGPSNYMSLLVDRARMEGFLVLDYADRYAEARGRLAAWRDQGRLRSREQVLEGIDMFPEALRMLLRGDNSGKLIVAVR